MCSLELSLMHLGVFRPHILRVGVPDKAVSAPSLPACLMVANRSHASMSLVALKVVVADLDAFWFQMIFFRIRSKLPVLL
jgi:hypothetical protein